MTPVATTSEPFALPAAHDRLRSDARELAAQFAPRALEVRQHFLDRSEMYPELWAAFCARGWPGLVAPAEYGGWAGGPRGGAVGPVALRPQETALGIPPLSASGP